MRRPVLLRRLLWILGVFLLGAFALLILLVWAIRVPHSPDLTRATAATLISSYSQFNKYAHLVKVSSATRGADSLKDCCYTAEFTFIQFGSSSVVPAHAEFRYYDSKWHLQEFWYGTPPDVETVLLGQN